MCGKSLGFVLLVWFPVALHAQPGVPRCVSPNLRNGYFLTEENPTGRVTKLTYACDNGYKPAGVESWWVISKCENGVWTPKPECINEQDCMPPKIPNAEYTKSQDGLYAAAFKIRITCDRGYEPKGGDVISICKNGTWSTLPVCEKSQEACGAPPKIPHATIVNQTYQELFAGDTTLQYECEDGYDIEAGGKKIICLQGTWTAAPACRIKDSCGAPPEIPRATIINQGDQQVFASNSALQYDCDRRYDIEEGERKIVCLQGTWTAAPACKRYCDLNPQQFAGSRLVLTETQRIFEGQAKHIPCDYGETSLFKCVNGRLTFSQCCTRYDHNRNVCP